MTKEERRREYAREYSRKYYARPEIKARMREYYTRPEVKARLREYYTRPEVKARAEAYHRKYRAKPEIRARERERVGLPTPTRPCPAVCECCGGPSGAISLCLDHCHDTGLFRGWLCAKCNTAIGKLGDTLEGLKRAVAYLEKYGTDHLAV